MNMLNNKCRTSFAKPEFLKKAQRANPRLYDIGCYNDNLALMLAPYSDEVIRLEKESRSKLSDLVRPFDYAKLNSLYDLFVPQIIKNTIEQNFCPVITKINVGLHIFLKRLNEEMVADLRYFNSLELEVDSLTSQLETQKTQFVNEIDHLCREYYYADHMNVILGVYTELDEVTNLQCDYLELLQKYECLETELSKSKKMSKSFESVQKHAINLELELQQCKEKVKNDMSFKVNKSKDFCKEREQCLNEKMVADLRYFNSLELEVDSLRYQLETQKTQFLNEIDRLSKEYYYVDHMNAILGVYTELDEVTNLQCDYLELLEKCECLETELSKNRVMRNGSQGKKQEVKDQRRSVKLSKNKTFVTACNDSLNAKTLNVNSVCATCDTCVLIDKHDMCVLNSVAKPLKRTVSSEFNQKPRNFTRKLYERVSKTCSWWYSKFTPSGYKWKPKSGIENVNSNVSMSLGNASRNANTSRRSTVSNTPLSSNSFAARKDCLIYRRLWVLKAHDGKSQASN
uniref:Uncharacterized protein n=1 Tax=Tanacetum cinerariifolium TaxID=118510 RepID=A0A699JDY9_TANCI|nr:hypothetical protein [Tanacetum cinerariifolium]